MSRIDRAIAAVSPGWAARRLRSRVQLGAMGGGFEGASSSRALQRWTPPGRSADADLLPDLGQLRNRSRDLVRNNPLAGGAIKTVRTNVVGTGLKLKAKVDRDALALTEEQAEAWERAAEREWRIWSRSPDCDAMRTSTFAQLQALAFQSVLENGDAFVLNLAMERPQQPYALTLQLIEADRVSNPEHRRDAPEMAGGIERDRFGAPVAYWIASSHPGDLPGTRKRTWTRVEAFGRRSGRRNVLHLYQPERIGQSRGTPYLAPVIEAFRQLGNYSQAELVAAVANACFSIVTKTESGGHLTPSPLANSASKEGAGELARVDMELEPGLIVEGLRPGEDMASFAPGRPNDAFDPFVQAVLRQIGVALELPYEILIKHFTASYSAARAALLEVWKFYRMRRAWLASGLCQPVYENLITEVVARGRLEAPGFFEDPAVRAAWLGADWIGPSPGQIDPLKEAQAAEKLIDTGISTLAEQTAAITGGDWEENLRQRGAEQRRMRDEGVAPPGTTGPAGEEAPALPPGRDSDREDE